MIPAVGASHVVILQPSTVETATPALPDAASVPSPSDPAPAIPTTPLLPAPPTAADVARHLDNAASTIKAVLDRNDLPPAAEHELANALREIERTRELAKALAAKPEYINYYAGVVVDVATGATGPDSGLCFRADDPTPCDDRDDNLIRSREDVEAWAFDVTTEVAGPAYREAVPVVIREVGPAYSGCSYQYKPSDTASLDECAEAVSDVPESPPRLWNAVARWFGFGGR